MKKDRLSLSLLWSNIVPRIRMKCRMIKNVFGPMLEAMLQGEMDNLGYDLDGIKDVFSLWISDIEGKHQPQQESCLH